MTEAATWRTGAPLRAPARGEIHVWRVALDERLPPWPALQDSLAGEEQGRAARFHFERDRRRYAATRAALRALLGAALGIAPLAIRFQYGEQGKPALHAEHENDLQFNVAHSHRLALIALARGMAVGVDVEHARQLEEMQHIAQRFFSAQEVAALAATAESMQHQTFFRIWSRKEAFIKATGKGLSQPLDAFDVVDRQGRPLPYVALQGRSTPWHIWDLDVGADYGAALVGWSEGQELAIRHFIY